MDFWGFLLGLIIVSLLIWLGLAGALVWGVTKLAGAIINRLGGKKPSRIHAPRHQNRMRAGDAQDSAHTADAASAPHTQAHASDTAQTTPPHNTGSYAATNASYAPRTQPRPTRDYEHLDVDRGADEDKIVGIMRNYENERVVGFYAKEVISALTMAKRRRQSLMSEIDSKFDNRSISWDHFAATTTEAFDTILHNCALLANRVQSFDVEDYERMEHFYRTGGEMRNGKQNAARLQRWEILRQTKDQMDDLRSANDGLLLELDKLAAALGDISNVDSTDESARIAAEVSRLAEETKYYR